MTDKKLLKRYEREYLQMIEDLNKPRFDGIKAGLTTRLHSGQIEVLRPLYEEGIKDLFLACGRKFGKSEVVGYVLWRHALENPGSACYYIGPEAAHARKIMWDKQRIQKFLGNDSEKYIATVKNQEMMVVLKNGSFIQIIGSDNYQVANGLTPDIAVYDEFKAFNPKWHIEFAPNRVAKAAPLVIIGTRPRAGNSNMEQYNEILEYAQNDPKSRVFFKTTWDNPINHLPEQKEMIEREIAQLRARGEEDVVQLEYYSNFVPGGRRAIFPMFIPDRYVKKHEIIMEEIKKDLKRLDWYVLADPGSTTAFGVLFMAINPYNKKVYILDEILETDQHSTSTRMIYPRIVAKCMELYPGSDIDEDWFKTYDEAAAWFSNEVMHQYGAYFSPTDKKHNNKEFGLSLIKDQLIHDMVMISDRCTQLVDEMVKYARDDKGNIPKRNDHLIDCYRYGNAASGYNMVEALERIMKSGTSFYDEMSKGRVFKDEKESDWSFVLNKDMFS